ncbi:hypothetical protein DRN43_02180 [Thermococci archaeon]|uniref:hypothetical protein n=1 Tax=Palaeococcus sp. (in: euryarchaeotes) TaxID=2820298 RepID=UPI000F1A21F3|nr:hypothetical protein [Palaeococcus sp. (in: euryarchaeotes)]MCD6558906.1 hypothetical protein [Palaeococcus sp. (in: euryarchaeotes)]RLF78406.1 MAG: hypothetical protein DRN39_01200 [Thermococci archaeon]RLF90223.1 MAG: hypothetical protein DRN43_02180 [Thermococci archaeon]
MDDRTLRTIEESIITLLIAWLSYLFIYQNYLLYRWHRGLPLPSRIPALLGGVAFGALYAMYAARKFERELEEKED